MINYQKTIQVAIDHVANNGKFILKSRCNGRKMPDHYFLNEDHTYSPCDLMTWVTQLEGMDRHVADEIINGKRVSTVWIGLNHNLGDGLPLVFETMIFNSERSDCYLDRYTTWDEAVAGHEKAKQWVLGGCKEDEQ